ncbi:alpha/beta hydrolase [Parvularcula flava]|uniref:Hydrolase n=1 Tax=Aquisalinus luteolus TaxID=1566827 RepID=A0A8J3A0C5_9PROT|nr:alpha/beta hydrolase [Aquisalinus luteolus]NHK26548.1 alpha/beta hydrolase [Aquisalinus luteolus]GGH92673.1 hydrolase [Aquisalinus luteolus]
MKALKIGLGIVAGLAAIYFGLASWLVFSPGDDPFADYPMDEASWRGMQQAGGTVMTLDKPFEERVFSARDGEHLFTRVYGPSTGTTIVFLHGVAADSTYLNNAAGLLHAATRARVITPDMRGVGQSGGDRYTVDYIGQYEDDVADMVAQLRKDNPDERIILAGHSMGGGVMLRHALLDDAVAPDAYLLFAPNFGEGPTQADPAAMDEQTRAFVRAIVHFELKRFIGLIMFDSVGVSALNDKPVLYFNAPPEMPAYSFSSVMSGQPIAPADTFVALAAIDVPLLVLVGENDDTFIASAYEPIVSANSDGETVVVPGQTHGGLINDPAVMDRVSVWMERF